MFSSYCYDRVRCSKYQQERFVEMMSSSVLLDEDSWAEMDGEVRESTGDGLSRHSFILVACFVGHSVTQEYI